MNNRSTKLWSTNIVSRSVSTATRTTTAPSTRLNTTSPRDRRPCDSTRLAMHSSRLTAVCGLCIHHDPGNISRAAGTNHAARITPAISVTASRQYRCPRAIIDKTKPFTCLDKTKGA
jgi:hypothetical protein